MISRAFSVMQALVGHPDGASYSQLMSATGLPRATIHRIVGALALEGAVTKLGGAGAIRLGPSLAQLGAAVQSNLRAIMRPYLERLQARSEETVDLTLLVEGQPVVIEQFVARHGLHVGSFPGRQLPIHCTASGRAHVSTLSRPAAENILSPELQFPTRPGSIERGLFIEAVMAVGPRDIHRDRSEWLDGVCAVAMPLLGPWPENFAIAVSMPAHRYEQKGPAVEAALRDCVEAISKQSTPS